MTDAAELNEPVQDGSTDATREQKISGLIGRVAADLALQPQKDLLTELRVRFSDAGIAVDETELGRIAGSIRPGK
ncbi:hypothetical protein [Frigoribacterium sp. CG_9.8]|uniref:hypothetical protein n=1 Tax=Frigoribacterium sp. CG_9.8 TaxID=2787733 RepID=UPI0018C948D6|nr:hypothetical protein [Frigoribacterium sp. CG_9.8]MBG6107839.1 hypothetical protein [Frigoribacterium sp. CG_9.8]